MGTNDYKKIMLDFSNSNAHWIDYEDFTWSSNYTHYAEFYGNGLLKSSNMSGYTDITVTYKLTGLSKTMRVYVNNAEYDWAADDPEVQRGRYSSIEDAALALAEIIANDYGFTIEKGGFIVCKYGGYYIEHIQGNAANASTDHIRLDIPREYDYKTIVAFMHSHLAHKDYGTVMYNGTEFAYVCEKGWWSYVVDICGCIFVLKPDAQNYMDYDMVRNNYS